MYKKVQSAKWFTPKQDGDFIEGIVEGVGQHEGNFGKSDYVNILDGNGETRVSITAGLSYINFYELEGERVKIIYGGMVNNPKTKRNYKSFEVLKFETDRFPIF